jgi:ribosomal protein S18 acetylase RimI-like enzyme
VGVLLINPTLEGDGWEVAYVGVVPEARRRGFGRELMGKALFEAKAAGQPHVTLSVDARNRPARALYHHLGFEPLEVREVFLAIWGADPPC